MIPACEDSVEVQHQLTLHLDEQVELTLECVRYFFGGLVDNLFSRFVDILCQGATQFITEFEFQALYAYSPYHNLKKGTRYPPTLITTADTDDRVVPGHSFKFAARLQYAQAGDAPVLARIETRVGHGAGKPTTKRIEEASDQWAFLVKNLGMKLPQN